MKGSNLFTESNTLHGCLPETSRIFSYKGWIISVYKYQRVGSSCELAVYWKKLLENTISHYIEKDKSNVRTREELNKLNFLSVLAIQ